MQRGLSPIVAVVLLLAIAVVSAVGLYFFAGGLATKQPTPNTPIAISAYAVDPANGIIAIANLGDNPLSVPYLDIAEGGTCNFSAGDLPILPGEQAICTMAPKAGTSTFYSGGTGSSPVTLPASAIDEVTFQAPGFTPVTWSQSTQTHFDAGTYSNTSHGSPQVQLGNSFLDPVEISTDTVTSYVDGEGDDIHLVSYNGTGLYYSKSEDSGATWSSLVFIKNATCTYEGTSGGQENAYRTYDITSDGDDVTLVFNTGTIGTPCGAFTGEVVSIHSSDGGDTWGELSQVSDTNLFQRVVKTASSGNNVYALWFRNNDVVGLGTTCALDCEMRFDKSTDGGATWNTDVNVSTPAVDAVTLWPGGLEVDGNNIYALWSMSSGGVYFNKSSDAGVNWPSSSTLSATGTMGDLEYSGGTLYAVWQDNGIQFSKSTDGGTTWGAEVEVIEGGGEDPKIVAHGGKLYVSFADGYPIYNPGKDIGYAISEDNGATWLFTNGQVPAALEGADEYVYDDPQLFSGNDLNLIWTYVDVGGPSSSLGVMQYGYNESGTFTSSMLDTTYAPAVITEVSWTTNTLPAGTTFEVELMYSNDSFVANEETEVVTDGQTVFAWTANQLKYWLNFTTDDRTVSPILYDFTVKYLPPTGNITYTVNADSQVSWIVLNETCGGVNSTVLNSTDIDNAFFTNTITDLPTNCDYWVYGEGPAVNVKPIRLELV